MNGSKGHSLSTAGSVPSGAPNQFSTSGPLLCLSAYSPLPSAVLYFSIQSHLFPLEPFAKSSESNNSPRMMKAHHRDKRHEPIPSSMYRSPVLRWRRYSSSIALLQTRRYSRRRPKFRRVSRNRSRSCRPRYKLRFRRRLNNRYLFRRRGIEVDILHLVRLHVCLFVSLLAAVLLCGASLNASLSLTANVYRDTPRSQLLSCRRKLSQAGRPIRCPIRLALPRCRARPA